jgi:hypothetical protein
MIQIYQSVFCLNRGFSVKKPGHFDEYAFSGQHLLPSPSPIQDSLEVLTPRSEKAEQLIINLLNFKLFLD